MDNIFLDFWILGSFAFPVLLFDTNSASENEPKSDQQRNRFRTGFYSVWKGSACRWGGWAGVTIYTYIYIYTRFICAPRPLCFVWLLYRCFVLSRCVMRPRYADEPIMSQLSAVPSNRIGLFHLLRLRYSKKHQKARKTKKNKEYQQIQDDRQTNTQTNNEAKSTEATKNKNKPKIQANIYEDLDTWCFFCDDFFVAFFGDVWLVWRLSVEVEILSEVFDNWEISDMPDIFGKVGTCRSPVWKGILPN